MSRRERTRRVDAALTILNFDHYLAEAREKLRRHIDHLKLLYEKIENFLQVDKNNGVLKNMLRTASYRIDEANVVVFSRDLKNIKQQDIYVVYSISEIKDAFWKGSDGSEYLVKRKDEQIVYVRAILLDGEKEHERVRREQRQINELKKKYVTDSKINF